MAPLPKPFQHTVLAIWDAYEKSNSAGDNLGVPMSQVGNECERAIWYSFRWASPPEIIDGQKQRKFNTGNIEEERLLDELENAGIQIERLDPATGSQFRISLADGWLRGKMDAKALGLPEAPKTLHVVECKSHNDRSFKELKKKPLKEAKPEHYAQCQLYMLAENLTRCLYLAVNKNNEELHAERIELDKVFARKLEAKVERIVQSNKTPPKLFENPAERAAFQCLWCPAKGQCHEGHFARVNCRTCIESEFQEGAVVRCKLLKKELSYDEQQAGCAQHRYLPSLVPGEQTDADEKTRAIIYKLGDGRVWVDQ